MVENERKKKIQNIFNEIAGVYDNHSLRFFIESAKHLASIVPIKSSEHILDIATGTGNVAIEIAKRFPDTVITGIDFSEGMLARAREKATNNSILNVNFLKMDMQNIAFPDNYFDVTNCSFGVFFSEDMIGFLHTMIAKLKPQGIAIVTTFHEGTFSPLAELFYERIKKFGVNVPTPGWKKISTKKTLIELLKSTSLHEIRIVQKKIGYYLSNVDEWWEIICSVAMKGFVNQLSLDKRNNFKREHLHEIQQYATRKGIWLEVEIMHAFGMK